MAGQKYLIKTYYRSFKKKLLGHFLTTIFFIKMISEDTTLLPYKDDSDTFKNEQSINIQSHVELKKNDGMTFFIAVLYVLTGVSQPLIVSIAKNAGLANPSCQLYMLFYYLGPALVVFTLCGGESSQIPTRSMIWKAALISIIDIFSQTMNYTGASMAGPTIFAVIYSSVTIWTAVYSRILLKRAMNFEQWFGVFLVFGGLTLTGFHSMKLGEGVFHGALLVVLGSSLHGLVYVLFECVMTTGEYMSVRVTCALQGVIASTAYGLWQIIYTRNHFQELVLIPMKASHTSNGTAWLILSSLGLSNLFHALAYFNTLKFFPGGATSAGILKGLQAVLVFVASSVLLCGKIGGEEMCFSTSKLLSLIIVLLGITIFGKGTGLHKPTVVND